MDKKSVKRSRCLLDNSFKLDKSQMFDSSQLLTIADMATKPLSELERVISDVVDLTKIASSVDSTM